MTNHVQGKTIVITGAGGGFGKLVSEKAAALGAKIMCADIDAAAGFQLNAAAAHEGDTLRHVIEAHVVEQDDVRAGISGLADLGERVGLYLDFQLWKFQPCALNSGGDGVGRT